MANIFHPLDPLTPSEVSLIAKACRDYDWIGVREESCVLRFNTISLKEPSKKEVIEFMNATESITVAPARKAFCILQFPPISSVVEAIATYSRDDNMWQIESWVKKDGVNPLASPDDCLESEQIVKADAEIQKLLLEKYGITDLSMICCDPWSVHSPPVAGRLIQFFMYQRIGDSMDNAYAHPLSFVPIVDLNLKKVIRIDDSYADQTPPAIPLPTINYHDKLCEKPVRTDLKALNILQPDGPSFLVNGNEIEWQKWKMRISFNYREGLVLHNVSYNDNGKVRPILYRASLVEMAVPYADPTYPYTRKCAFDVGDYGLGNCTFGLELGCDCLGHIHYFDGVLNNSLGEPVVIKKAVCMHEEDHGTLWKHVEFRNGNSQVRRSRRLVVSFVATVVNYEYCFYWYFYQDGSIQYEIKLTGELSTNPLSPHELADGYSQYGTMVADGVNAQFHQHLFCARIDMAVDDLQGGRDVLVSEVDIIPHPAGEDNIMGNIFKVSETPLLTEHQAQRVNDASKARSWKVSNPSVLHPVTKKPVAWKLLVPGSPLLLATEDSLLTKRGRFATKQLWVTPHSDEERWPAGDYTFQSVGGEGLEAFTAGNRDCGPGSDPVVWLTLSATHVPRVEDFPVMPVETVGFWLKPFCFFDGNPGVDVPVDANVASVLAGNTCCCATSTA